MVPIPTPHVLTSGQRAVVLWAYGRRQQPFTVEQAVEGLGYSGRHLTHAKKCVEWCVKRSMLTAQEGGAYTLSELARFLAANINAALADERSSVEKASAKSV